MILEKPYPKHWLIAGGSCATLPDMWRAGICMLCNEFRAISKAENEDDGEWVDRFVAEIELHDATKCGTDKKIIQ